MYERLIERRVRHALSDTPVVMIIGPRRAGKTTLVQRMNTDNRAYLTLDDQTVLEAARSDPQGFIRGRLSRIASANAYEEHWGIVEDYDVLRHVVPPRKSYSQSIDNIR